MGSLFESTTTGAGGQVVTIDSVGPLGFLYTSMSNQTLVERKYFAVGTFVAAYVKACMVYQKEEETRV